MVNMIFEIAIGLILTLALFIGFGGVLAGGALELLGGVLLFAGVGTVIASRDPLLIGLVLLLFVKKLVSRPKPKNELDYYGGSYPWYSP